MLRSFFSLGIIFIIAISLTACSNGKSNPATPGSEGLKDISARLPIYVHPAPEGFIAGEGALGLYQVSIDTKNMSYDLVPVRTSSFVPNEFEVDLTSALTNSFCKNCFRINSIGLAGNGNIVIDVGVKHPFPQITAIPSPKPQRPDLHVFDVQGIVIADGSQQFTRSSITLNPTFCANPDGFTTAFDTAIDALGAPYSTTANAHAFKILSKGNYVNPSDETGNYDIFSLNGYPSPAGLMNPTGFNVLKCGADYMNTTFELNPPGTSFTFFFAVTCSFGESSKGLGNNLQKRGSPIYLLPAFSKPEAWNVSVGIENNNLADNDNTSTADVVVRVCDWQEAYGHSPADPTFDPAANQTTQRNQLLQESGINLVEIDIPGLNLPIDNSSAVVPGGNGSYLNPRTFRIVVNNDTFASEIPDPSNPPQFWGIAAVRDDLYGTPNPTGGIDRNLVVPDSVFQISDYTTYQLFGISIFPPNDPPVPVLACTAPVVGPPWPININSGDSPDFNGLSSYDTDGSIVAYEWDFDYDPVTEIFTVDYTDANPVTAADPPVNKMNNQLNVPASKYVALRVTDDSPAATKVVGYVQVDIGANNPPVADLGIYFYTTALSAPYTFYEGERVTLKPGPLTSDDGQITTYQYDFDYDSVTPFFTVDAANTTGLPVMSPVQAIGTRNMAVRVIDNGIPNENDMDFKNVTILARAARIPVRLNSLTATDVWCDSSGLHAVAATSTTIVAAWRQIGIQGDLFYAVSSDGGATWTPQAVLNTATNGTQRNISLAADPSTNIFYAVFESNAVGAYDITYAVSNAGATAWPSQGQVVPPLQSPNDPSVCVNPSSAQIYVAYQGVQGASDVIFVRTSTTGGSTWNAGVAASTSLPGDKTDPCIAFNTTDSEVGVAWDDYRNSSQYQIYFNWSNATGTAFQVADVQIAPSGAGQNDPSVAVRSGTWIITYDDLTGTSDVFSTTSANGTIWTAAIDCTDNTDSQHNDSSICVDGAGTIYMATTDSRQTGSPTDRDVFVFKSVDGGATWIRGVRVDSGLAGDNAYKPSIVGLPGAGGFIVMYESPDNAVYAAASNAY